MSFPCSHACINILNNEKMFIAGVFWTRSELLCSQRNEEFLGSHFSWLGPGASAYTYMAITLLGFRDLFWLCCKFGSFWWHPANGAVSEAGNAPSHRAAGVNTLLPQLTKFFKTWENEGKIKIIRLSTSFLAEVHPQVPATRRLYPFFCVLHGHRHHFQKQDLFLSKCKIIKQLEPQISDLPGKYPYQRVMQEPSICLTCYF